MGKSGHSSFQFILGLGQLQLVMLDALFTVRDVLGGSGRFLLQFSDSVVLFCVAVFTLFHFQGADLTQLFQELLFLIFEFFDDLGHFFLLFFSSLLQGPLLLIQLRGKIFLLDLLTVGS